MDRQNHLARTRVYGVAVIVEQQVESFGGGDEGGLGVGLALVAAVNRQLLARYWQGLDHLVVGHVTASLSPLVDGLQGVVVDPAGVHLHQVRQLGSCG